MIPFILAAVGGAILGNAFSSDIEKLSEGGVIVNKEGVSTDARKGGIFKGKRHSEGGIAVDVIGGSPVEVETDEALIVNNEANSTKTVTLDGKKMTPREVLSTINQSYGGVPIKKKGGTLDTEEMVNRANKSKEPVVVEGGSIVITRNAILDDKTKHEFNGKMMTNKEILSEVNKMNGGVEFAKGGSVKGKKVCIRSKGKADFKTWVIIDATSPYSYATEIEFDDKEQAEKYADKKAFNIVSDFIEDDSKAKGGNLWIKDAIKNKGALRRTAKRKGLLTASECLNINKQ